MPVHAKIRWIPAADDAQFATQFFGFGLCSQQEQYRWSRPLVPFGINLHLTFTSSDAHRSSRRTQEVIHRVARSHPAGRAAFLISRSPAGTLLLVVCRGGYGGGRRGTYARPGSSEAG